MTHKDWLDNEYKLWIEALQYSTVDNFKYHPQVKRMLGEVPKGLYRNGVCDNDYDLIKRIDQIGFSMKTDITGACERMVYWAVEVLRQNPKSIVEIGGGVGEFYAIIRALGFKGKYYIFDLPEVKHFQNLYLEEINRQTGLNTIQSPLDSFDTLVSFYAIGEFTDELKKWYLQDNTVTAKCPHGFILWNAHSGASEEINIPHKNVTIQPETPFIHPGNFIVQW